MKIIDLEQNTPEWSAFRRTHIGASESPIIMGVSPWCTPYALWLRKVGLAPELEQNDAMRRGHALEEEARQHFIDLTLTPVCPLVAVHSEYEWMSASFDGINIDQETLVEIKCPGEKDHRIAMIGGIPDKYYPQLQHQLAVAGYDKMFYYSYYDGFGVSILVYRDDEYIANLIQKEKEFYNHMKNLTSPPMTNKDFNEKDDNSEWDEWSMKYFSVKLYRERYQRLEDEAKQKLIELCDGQSSRGKGLKVQKIVKKGMVDYSIIPELKEVDLEKYRKPISEYWKLEKYS
jgi:putative phage-type endonuclease